MPDPSDQFQLSRRQFLQATGGLAGAVSLNLARQPTSRSEIASNSTFAKDNPLLRKPNLIVIMTDQERYHTHWPVGWAETNLPALQRLKQKGLTFKRAYTAACECSPSRALMLTSQFAPVNRVSRTMLWPGLPTARHLPNIGSLLKQADYTVVWKGKWHLSFAGNAAPGNGGEDWQTSDIALFEQKFGWSGWNPPDAGTTVQAPATNMFGKFNGLATLGGGTANNDGRYVSGVSAAAFGQTAGVGGKSVLEFLAQAPALSQPFCLFISLVNPHDIGFYPQGWEQGGYNRGSFAHLNIDLPPNYRDDLMTKPEVQRQARSAYDQRSPLPDLNTQRDYVNFYAYLNQQVDRQVMTILDAVEANGLTESTLIFRFSDHGELGLSHGMREKSYTAYEEMIHIPLVVSNPHLFPEPLTTDAFYSHLDLLPTLAELAGVPNASTYGQGKSIVPVLQNPRASVQDSILFTYDDVFILPTGTPGAHIRAIREGDWTYAAYFGLDGSGLSYELYDLSTDPGQLLNLVYDSPSKAVIKEWRRLHTQLTQRLIDVGNLPTGFSWPLNPTRSSNQLS